jgi:hypothetical protein
MTKIEKEIIDGVNSAISGVFKHEKRYAVIGIIREVLDKIHAERKYIPADILRSYQSMTPDQKEEAHRIYGEQTFTWASFESIILIGHLVMEVKEEGNKNKVYSFVGHDGKTIYAKVLVSDNGFKDEVVHPFKENSSLWNKVKKMLCK